MKVALLCSYRKLDEGESPLGLELIAPRLAALGEMGLEAICVIGGPQADSQLREAMRFPNCEIEFDGEAEPTLISNARAAAALAGDESLLIHPIEVPMFSRDTALTLRRIYGQVGLATAISCLRLTDGEGAPYHFGFPLLVTRRGVQLLRSSTPLTGLTDAKLEYLASPAFPL